MSNYKHNHKKSNKNIDTMREIVRNTEENMQEAEISMEFADTHEKAVIKQQNERRKEAIGNLKEEIKEEVWDRKKGQ